MATATRRLAAIMFTDIVGYTVLMGKDENKTVEILRKNRAIHTKCINKFNGSLIKEMGDGIMAQFSSALDAIQCAIEVQGEVKISLENQLRIGIHLGEVMIEKNDIFGDGVNVAARLESIADPGGIYISESIYEVIRSNKNIQAEFIGHVELKNVDRNIIAYYIKSTGLPTPSREKIQSLLSKKEQTAKKSGTPSRSFLSYLKFPWKYWGELTEKTEKKINSLAVLPIENINNNPEEEWLKTGIHHALIDELSKIHSLRVVSRTSSLKFQGTTLSIPEIAQDLDVDGLVEASFYTERENVNIQVRLIQARPHEKQIWMQSFDRALKNVLTVYSDVANAIARETNISLNTLECKHIFKAGSINPVAYEAYLRGMSMLENLTEVDLERALRYFLHAKSIDQTYALAYVGIAWYWIAQMQQGFKPKEESMPKLKDALKKAQDLDNSIAEIHWLLAGVKLNHDWDWESAGMEYQLTFEINPNYAIAQAYYSHYLAIMGRPEEGLRHSELAMKLDPFNTLYQAIYGMALKNARKYEEAHSMLMRALSAEPNDRIALPSLWCLYHKLKKYKEALQIAQRIYTAKKDKDVVRIIKEFQGKEDYESIILRLTKMMISRREKTYVPPFQIATLYTRAGLCDSAVHWLKKAFEARDPNMIYINIDPLFDHLRDNQGFKNLIRLMKFPKVSPLVK